MQQLTPAENAVIGITVSFPIIGVCQPLVYLKTASQQGIRLTMNPAMLYRGAMANLINEFGMNGGQFVLNGMTQKMINRNSEPTYFKQNVAAAAAGAISAIFVSPLELVMIQQQRHGGSMMSTVKSILNSSGAATLGRGLVSTTIRETTYTMGALGIAPCVKHFLQTSDLKLHPTISQGLGSILGGTFAALISHPFDTVKTCMQGDLSLRATSPTGKMSMLTMSQTFRLHDPKQLYRGFTYRWAFMTCSIFLIIEWRARFGKILFPHAFEGMDEDALF